jgi:hypothetical protein
MPRGLSFENSAAYGVAAGGRLNLTAHGLPERMLQISHCFGVYEPRRFREIGLRLPQAAQI